jgi:hypothetical protein
LLTLQRDTPTDTSPRIITLLTILAALNLFDLAFTQSQLPRGNFAEANALALMLSKGSPLGMLTYKLIFFGAGAAILYRLRHHWQSEAALWLVTACYGGLMVWWVAYLRTVEICLGDPCVGQRILSF